METIERECICGAPTPEPVRIEPVIEVRYYGCVWGNTLYDCINDTARSYASAANAWTLSHAVLQRIAKHGFVKIKMGMSVMDKEGNWKREE
jgi:hypothetical protein